MRIVVRLLGVFVLASLVAGVETGKALPAEAAFPGDSGKLAVSTCVQNPSPACHIFLTNADGSGATPNLAAGVYPSWSPDGTKIAFNTVSSQIMVMNEDGTGIAPLGLLGSGPGWSPDGGRIAFNGGPGIVVADVGGTVLQTLGVSSVGASPVRWSPDGNWLLFASNAPGGDINLSKVHPDGSGLTPIVQSPKIEAFGDWSPDGTKVVYAEAAVGQAYDTYVVNADGTGRQLVSSTSDGFHLAWSPDGTQIAFQKYDNPSSGRTYVMSANGSGIVAVPGTADAISGVSWQPTKTIVAGVEFTQGIQVLQSVPELMNSLSGSGGVQPQAAPAAFPGDNGLIAFNGPNGTIDTISPTGGTVTSLDEGRNPAWSPDGAQIAYEKVTVNGSEVTIDIYTMNADGTGSAQVTSIGRAIQPAWSPDGERLVYLDLDQAQIWTIDPNGSDPQQVTDFHFLDANSRPRWSPDGTKILFSGIEGGDSGYDLFTISPQGSNLTNVTNTPSQLGSGGPWNFEGQADWSPDGTKIAFLGVFDNSGQNSIYTINASGGGRQRLTSEAGHQTWPSWSPDGARILYSAGAALTVMDAANGANKQPVGATGHYADWQPDTRVVRNVEFTQGIQVLQPLSALQSDLAGDGKPPVPIIEGKPAAMRIYFAEVDQATDYSVQVSGAFSDNEIVNLTPGCTPTQRRAQTGGCKSVDFFFTPPTGNWTVRLIVEDILNHVVLDEEFDLTSVYMGELDIQYLPICFVLTGDFLPTCPTSAVTGSGVTDLTKKLFPISPGDLHYGRFPVPNMIVQTPMTTWDEVSGLLASLRLRYDLMALGNLAPDQLAGWVPAGANTVPCGPNGTQTCVVLGIADALWAGSGGTGRVTWQTDQNASGPQDSQFTFAHETAHNFGARHAATADGCGAADANSGWPYADATIQEVGFDVEKGTAISGTKKDLLSYCTPPVSNIWVSPHTYNKLVDSVFVPQGFGVNPAGAPIQQLLVKGSAQADGSAGVIESAYVITSSQAATPPNPLGNYCLRTSGAAALEYCFLLTFTEHRSGEAMDTESFSIRMPLPAGTTRVSLAKGFLELDALELTASAPSVDLTTPGELQGEETIEWSGSDGDGDLLKYALMYTPDDGQTWYPIAVDLTEPEFAFDTSVLEGDEITLRVLASDGLNTTVQETGPVTVIHGTERVWGDANCSGTADPVDALLTLRFNSGLSAATGECPAFGEEVEVPGGASFPWGDVDCTGDVGPVDSLKVLRYDSGLSVSQEPGCPPLGDGVLVAASFDTVSPSGLNRLRISGGWARTEVTNGWRWLL